MAKPSNFHEEQTWGTLEELLLACAVHRYGTDSWDSVAKEVRKRISYLNPLTGHICKQKYHDLKRRFPRNLAVSESETNNNTSDISATTPWLEELKKLRVAELRREVERYDLSIVSLQLKVKKLKEEREQSYSENEKEMEKSDPEKTERNGEVEKNRNDREPEIITGKPASSNVSDRDNRSVNESNSTDLKYETTENKPVESDKGVEPAKPETGEATRPGDHSGNGSCENWEQVSLDREEGESPQRWESVAESKSGGGEEEPKDGSDVQSSASLSRSEKGVQLGEPEEDQSPPIKPFPVESQPLADFLQILRRHSSGSAFERRLESQGIPNCTSLIRQQIDLETIRSRLEEGWYSDSSSKFFRDLLLLFNNAIIFFRKQSAEYLAAIEFRQIVMKELALKIPVPVFLPEEQLSDLKLDLETSRSLVVKPRIRVGRVPIIACRKRSSITTKTSALFATADKKRELMTNLIDEKTILDLKQQDTSLNKAEENRFTKKRTRESSTSSATNSSKNSKSRVNSKTKRNSDLNPNIGFSSKEASNDENLLLKAEKEKKSNTNASSKKQGAANLLNRMKRSSLSKDGALLETTKNSGTSSENGKGAATEHKKMGNGKEDAPKDQANPRKASGGNRAKEPTSTASRTVGRPPKRTVAPATPPSAALAKRSRESSETQASTSRQAKKRSRK